MTARPRRESDDDARQSYDEAIKALREKHIRAGAIQPRADSPEELQWAREGPKQPGAEVGPLKFQWIFDFFPKFGADHATS